MNRFKFREDKIYICAEIGINHNGNLDLAKKLIEKSAEIGCDFVKFQKRTPKICVPEGMRDIIRTNTPWGDISYMDYREKVEFGKFEYDEIDKFCKKLGILWTASPWDEPSVEFLAKYDVPFLKIPSACLTDRELLQYCSKTNIPIVLSTGMSNLNMIRKAVLVVLESGGDLEYILHCTSTYPAEIEDLNLSGIRTLKNEFPSIKIGYSGHERSVPPTVLAIGVGAKFIERHITLDRSMWGSDQSASLEFEGMRRIVSAAKVAEKALGDGNINILDSEKPLIERLRRKNSL